MNLQTTSVPVLPESYCILLENIKARLRESQLKAAMSVNQELI